MNPQGSSSVVQFKSISSVALRLLYGPTLAYIPDYWKNHSFDYSDLCKQSDVFVYVCHRFSSKEQLPLNFKAVVTICSNVLEPKKIKSVTASNFSPSICYEVLGLDAMILGFWLLSFKLSPTGSLVYLCFLPLRWYHLHIWDCWYFLAILLAIL